MTINATTLLADKTTSGSIKNWVNRSDIPVTDILTEAQAWIYGRLRCMEMITVTTLSLGSGVETLATPSDFIAAITIQLDDDGRPLDKVDMGQLAERRYRNSTGVLTSGKPTVFAALPSSTGAGGTYYFDMKTDQAYEGDQTYYARPAALAITTNETNFLTVRYPSILRMACLTIAYQYMQDWNRAEMQARYASGMIAEANQESDLALAGAIFDMEVR